MPKRKQPTTEEKSQLLEMFQNYDTDKNGILDHNEVKEAIQDMNSHLELLGLGLSDKDIEEMIQRADKNQDGKIQIEEFVNLM